jgi:hypothetical protein
MNAARKPSHHRDAGPDHTNTLSKAFAQRLRERAVQLANADTKARLELGQALHELYYGAVEVAGGELAVWKFFGHDSWFDYVETEVGLHVSTAAGYRLVWDVFGVKLDGAWDKSINVSFTKLKAILPVVNAKNVNAWLRRAEKHTCCELEDLVHVERFGNRRRRATRHFTALLTDQQLTEINTVLELARDRFPKVKTRGDLLLRIVGEWDAAARKVGGARTHLRVVGGK